MTTIDDLIEHLDRGMALADLQGLDAKKLRRLEGLLYHWQQLATHVGGPRDQSGAAEAGRAFVGESSFR